MLHPYPWIRSERDPEFLPTSTHKAQQMKREEIERHLLLGQLLVLARVAIGLVERQETAEDPVWLDVAEIAALVLRDYGDRKLSGLLFEGGKLDQGGIVLFFRTPGRGQEVEWSLTLTRHKPGKSEPSP